MTLVSVTALVATPLLSPLVIGHGTLTIGMLTMRLLLFDHPYSPLPCFGSEVEALPSHHIVSVSYCLSQAATYLPGPIVGQQLLSVCSYCLILLIVLRPSEDRTAINIVWRYYTA